MQPGNYSDTKKPTSQDFHGVSNGDHSVMLQLPERSQIPQCGLRLWTWPCDTDLGEISVPKESKMFQFPWNKEPVLLPQSTVDLYEFTVLDLFIQYSLHSHMLLALLGFFSCISQMIQIYFHPPVPSCTLRVGYFH